MSSALSYGLVALGGAIGAATRYGVTQAAVRWFGHGFPVGTMLVNIIGSFAMGLLVSWLALRAQGGSDLRLLLATGVLGGFTTFSAFSLDAITLYERGAFGGAAAYVGLSVGLCLIGVAIGLWAGRSAFG